MPVNLLSLSATFSSILSTFCHLTVKGDLKQKCMLAWTGLNISVRELSFRGTVCIRPKAVFFFTFNFSVTGHGHVGSSSAVKCRERLAGDTGAMHGGLVWDVTDTNSWALKYWWDLLQESLLSWQKFCHHKYNFCRDKSCLNMYTFVMAKDLLCHDKSMLVATNVLLWQNYVCHDKYFVATNVMFLTTTLLSWQACFCHDKTCLLSWQTHACYNNNDTCAAPANDTERLAGDTVTTIVHSHYCVEHAVLIRDVTNTNSWPLKGSTHGCVFTTVKHQFSSDWTRNLVKNWVYLIK